MTARGGPRRVGKCQDCARRFWVRFAGQRFCTLCAGDRRRAARARVQPDLPLEGDARGG